MLWLSEQFEKRFAPNNLGDVSISCEILFFFFFLIFFSAFFQPRVSVRISVYRDFHFRFEQGFFSSFSGIKSSTVCHFRWIVSAFRRPPPRKFASLAAVGLLSVATSVNWGGRLLAASCIRYGTCPAVLLPSLDDAVSAEWKITGYRQRSNGCFIYIYTPPPGNWDRLWAPSSAAAAGSHTRSSL